MVDIISDIVLGDNPLGGESDESDEDTNAEPVPDLFERERRLFTAGEPSHGLSTAVRAGLASTALMCIWALLDAAHVITVGHTLEMELKRIETGELGEAENGEHGNAVLQLIEDVFRALAHPLLVPLCLDLVTVIHPSTGHLVMLGAGTQKVASRSCERLLFWRKAAMVGYIVCTGWVVFVGFFFCFMIYYGLIDTDGMVDDETGEPHVFSLGEVIYWLRLKTVALAC